MSTANDMREAASAWSKESPGFNHLWEICRTFKNYDDIHGMRSDDVVFIGEQNLWFLLVIAEALDGGERKPMTSREIDILMMAHLFSWICCASAAQRSGMTSALAASMSLKWVAFILLLSVSLHHDV